MVQSNSIQDDIADMSPIQRTYYPYIELDKFLFNLAKKLNSPDQDNDFKIKKTHLLSLALLRFQNDILNNNIDNLKDQALNVVEDYIIKQRKRGPKRKTKKRKVLNYILEK